MVTWCHGWLPGLVKPPKPPNCRRLVGATDDRTNCEVFGGCFCACRAFAGYHASAALSHWLGRAALRRPNAALDPFCTPSEIAKQDNRRRNAGEARGLTAQYPGLALIPPITPNHANRVVRAAATLLAAIWLAFIVLWIYLADTVTCSTLHARNFQKEILNSLGVAMLAFLLWPAWRNLRRPLPSVELKRPIDGLANMTLQAPAARLM
jgi:hypothetical protein